MTNSVARSCILDAYPRKECFCVCLQSLLPHSDVKQTERGLDKVDKY